MKILKLARPLLLVMGLVPTVLSAQIVEPDKSPSNKELTLLITDVVDTYLKTNIVLNQSRTNTPIDIVATNTITKSDILKQCVYDKMYMVISKHPWISNIENPQQKVLFSLILLDLIQREHNQEIKKTVNGIYTTIKENGSGVSVFELTIIMQYIDNLKEFTRDVLITKYEHLFIPFTNNELKLTSETPKVIDFVRYPVEHTRSMFYFIDQLGTISDYEDISKFKDNVYGYILRCDKTFVDESFTQEYSVSFYDLEKYTYAMGLLATIKDNIWLMRIPNIEEFCLFMYSIMEIMYQEHNEDSYKLCGYMYNTVSRIQTSTLPINPLMEFNLMTIFAANKLIDPVSEIYSDLVNENEDVKCTSEILNQMLFLRHYQLRMDKEKLAKYTIFK